MQRASTRAYAFEACYVIIISCYVIMISHYVIINIHATVPYSLLVHIPGKRYSEDLNFRGNKKFLLLENEFCSAVGISNIVIIIHISPNKYLIIYNVYYGYIPNI